MTFHEIKEAVPASQVLTHILGPSRRHTWHCPFHDDRTPSLSAYGPAIRCFGCQWAGDIFRFVEDHLKVDRGESLRICADIARVILPARTTGVRRFRLPSLGQSLAQVHRESEKISVEITVITRQCAADAWRRAWDARGSEAVWDAVAIGAALDHEVAIIEMGMPCEKSA